MKKIVAVSLFIFWALVVAILTAGLLFYGQRSVPQAGAGQSLQNSSGQGLVLTPEEVAKHNSASDCWLLISGKVYDVTGYLPSHPGGPGTILPYCGRDATAAFETQDRGKPHSNAAWDMLNAYYIGDANKQLTQQPQNAPASPSGNKWGRIPRQADDED